MSIETKTYDISEIEEIITNENKQDNHKEKIADKLVMFYPDRGRLGKIFVLSLTVLWLS